MPELPEVEVVRRDLDPLLVGRVLARVEVGRDRAVRREPSPGEFVAALTGRRVRATGRVGKFLVVELDDRVAPEDGALGTDVVVVHLGMSGQLRYAPSTGTPRPGHTHVVWALDDGSEVRFVDPRTFGQMVRSRAPAPGGRPAALAHLGPDAWHELGDPAVLAARLAGRRVAVKARLMDQTAVAGLGNIYTDEILFRAGVSGARPAGAVTATEVDRLLDAVRDVLHEAVAERGSSLADAQYVDLHGRPGRFQHRHAVHARAGEPCPACGRPVVRSRIGGRSGYSCPRCQV